MWLAWLRVVRNWLQPLRKSAIVMAAMAGTKTILGRTVFGVERPKPRAYGAQVSTKAKTRHPVHCVVKRLKAEAEKELADTGVQIGSANSDGRL